MVPRGSGDHLPGRSKSYLSDSGRICKNVALEMRSAEKCPYRLGPEQCAGAVNKRCPEQEPPGAPNNLREHLNKCVEQEVGGFIAAPLGPEQSAGVVKKRCPE